MRVVLSDAELLEMFRNDNTEGYRLIVRKYQERIYWQIRRITKKPSRHGGCFTKCVYKSLEGIR